MALALARCKRKLSTLIPTTFSRLLSLAATSEPVPTLTPDPRFLRHPAPDPHALVDHTPFLRFPDARVTSLPNGIRVTTQAYPCPTRMASVGVWVDAGSRFEAPGTNGAAHFLEHMVFKGTPRRPTPQWLEEEIENMGAKLNAYTSREQTTFFADVKGEDVAAAVDVLADILQNSKFDAKAIKRESGVILREMESVHEQMSEVIFDHLHSAAFVGHPLGNTILGPEENIRSMTRNSLQQYISTHYTGPRMVVSAAGAVNHDEVVDLVKKMFNKFSTDPTTAHQLVQANPAVFTGAEVRVENDQLPLTHLAIAFEGASWSDPYSIPLMVMQSLIGSWSRTIGIGNCSGSELARRISTEGLAESMFAFNTNYTDTGLVGIYTTAAPACMHELSRVMMEEFRRLAYAVTETEVARARNQIKSSLVLHIDGSTAVAENNGRQMLTFGRIMPLVELFARIDAVDSSTIQETAKKFLINKDVAIAAVGQLHSLPPYEWFRSQTQADWVSLLDKAGGCK